jgi:hypothetical protein
MNVSKRDVGTLAIFSILGSLAGLVYGSASLYSSRRVGSRLRVQALMLPRDTTLYAIAGELERMEVDSFLFHRLINTIDQLLYLRYGLSDGNLKPAEGQEEKANELIVTIREDLNALRTMYEKKHTENEALDVARLVGKVAEILDNHLVYITRRTILFRK